MTKNDYEIVARVIKQDRVYFSRYQQRILVEDLCEAFLVDNYRFDKKKFIKACGMEVKA